jgi:hypothetical protein
VLDGEAVVINLDTGAYFGLNATASVLWGLLEAGPGSTESLAGALAAAHDHDLAEVTADVRFFLEGLERDGLIVTTDAPAGLPSSLPGAGPYLAPIAERYDTLDELMLSGE